MLRAVAVWVTFQDNSGTQIAGGFLSNSPKISPRLKKRATQIEVLLMDVDGTMTDGGVTLLPVASPDVKVQLFFAAPTR